MVDRPDVEAPQGVELTGTNSRTATHTPPHKGWQDKRNNHFTRMTGRHPAHHTTDPSAHTRPPSGPQAATQPPGTPDKDPRDDNYRFAAAMAQGRRPDPFRTRKRRPGTAMVLHPTGCGRVARRRTNTPRRGRDATHAPPPSFYFQNTHQPAATHTGHPETQQGQPQRHDSTQHTNPQQREYIIREHATYKHIKG